MFFLFRRCPKSFKPCIVPTNHYTTVFPCISAQICSAYQSDGGDGRERMRLQCAANFSSSVILLSRILMTHLPAPQYGRAHTSYIESKLLWGCGLGEGRGARGGSTNKQTIQIVKDRTSYSSTRSLPQKSRSHARVPTIYET